MVRAAAGSNPRLHCPRFLLFWRSQFLDILQTISNNARIVSFSRACAGAYATWDDFWQRDCRDSDL